MSAFLNIKEMGEKILEEKENGFEENSENSSKEKKSVMIARNALKKNMSVNDIADITGLTFEEIEQLKKSEQNKC